MEEIDIIEQFLDDELDDLYEIYHTGYINKVVMAIKQVINRLEQDERVIEEAIEFIKDNCIEEIADMKGHYREVASIGDLEELLDILKRN